MTDHRSADRRVFGLTGGIGAGKSTVAAELAALGATVVDCDRLGRVVVEPDGAAYQPLVERFGSGILRGDGALDRPRLASQVFGDPQALADLNAITHPAIDVEIARAVAASSTPTVVLDMAVLVESDLGKGQYGEVLVVEAPLEVRLRRLVGGRGMAEEEARARIASQVGDVERRLVADHVIVNDGSLDDLRAGVGRFWEAAGLR
jgi:dephospho-CoA kinase